MNARALILAAALIAPAAAVSAPAAAQAWKVYAYSADGFAVQLPAAPTLTKGEFRTAAGVTVPADVYTLRQDDIVYTMTVADFTKAAANQQAAIAEAVKAYGAAGEVKVDVSERIDQQFGRQLSVTARDGARSTVSVFFVNGKLYELEGKALPPDPGSGSGKAVRYQQSLEFIGLGAEARRPENQAGGFGGPGGRGPGGPGGRGGPPQQAFDACQGKAPGAAIQLNTPQGPVDATCVLAARPNRPPPGGGQPPGGRPEG